MVSGRFQEMSHPRPMLCDQDVNYNLIWPVRKGKLERARQLINSFGLSYSRAWYVGYLLLRGVFKFCHRKSAKLLLRNSSRVRGNCAKPANTPFHVVALNDNIEIIKIIVDNSTSGRTRLHNVVENIKIEVIELHLKHSEYDNAKDNDSLRPLNIAIKKKSLELIDLLLKFRTDINHVIRSSWGKQYTPLHFAIAKGRKDIVTILLSKSGNMDVKVKDNMSPLYITAQNAHAQIAEDLINYGAYIQSVTLNVRYTPSHFACKAGKEEILKLCLNAGADINARIIQNLTPLHRAIKNGNDDVIKLFLQNGAKVDYEDKDHKTILLAAVERRYLIVVEDILKHGPDINNRSKRNCFLGFGVRFKKIVEAILEYDFYFNSENVNDPNILNATVINGYLNIVEDLLKCVAYAWKRNEGFTPLHSAVKNKQYELAKLLINYGADLNAKNKMGRTPIFYAIKNADLRVTRLLLMNRANVKENPDLLHIAVQKKCLQIIEVLLQYDADVNACDDDGRTALYYTTFCNSSAKDDSHIQVQIAELLLRSGANLDIKTEIGKSTLSAVIKYGHAKVAEAFLKYAPNVNFEEGKDIPLLHLSVERGDKEICLMLLRKGAHINAKQKNGKTALHIATGCGDEQLVDLLLERGAKVNCKTEYDKSTPLHSAAYSYNGARLIESLLKFDAYVDSTNVYGETALHVACKEENMEIVQALLEEGPNVNITDNAGKTCLEVLLDFNDVDSDFFDSDEFDSDDFDDTVYEDIVHILKFHTVKLKAANLYVSENNLRCLRGSDLMYEFELECGKEIAMMKSEKINNNISFYDVLTKATRSLVKYTRNESILDVLESGTHKTKYPIYGNMIERHFVKGRKRKDLIDQGSSIFHTLFHNLPKLPYFCIEELFSYLSNEELRILVDAY